MLWDLCARLRTNSKVLRQFCAYEQKRIKFTVPGNDGWLCFLTCSWRSELRSQRDSLRIGGSKMNSVQAILGILASLLVVQTTFTVGELYSQEMAGTMHEHLTGVACGDVPPGQERPEFGCFNIATENGLRFQQPQVY